MRIIILAVSLSLPGNLRAQEPTSSLQLVYSYYFFANDDSTSLVDFAYQFSNQGVTYRVEDDGLRRARMLFRLVFRRSNASAADSMVTEWGNVIDGPTADDTVPRPVLAIRKLALPPGSYSVRLYAEDANDSTRQGSSQFTLDIPDYRIRQTKLSSIEVADQLYRKNVSDSPFAKNGYMVVPNVTSEIRGDVPTLSSYVELYHADGPEAGTIEVTYRLAIAKTRTIFFERSEKLEGPFPAAFVLTDNMPVDSLPSGEYYLIVSVRNGSTPDNAATSASAAFFTLFNPAADQRLQGSAADEHTNSDESHGIMDLSFAGRTESELDLEWAKSHYIATNSEQHIWEGLTGAEAKARHLTQFWLRRDNSPETPENEFRLDYYKRAAEAGHRYATMMAPNGWDSDPGRILLVYGRPDGIDRHPQDFNTKPYEVWSYSALGYQFVFVDRRQTGLYILVHSNAPHETKDENWLERYALINKKWVNE